MFLMSDFFDQALQSVSLANLPINCNDAKLVDHTRSLCYVQTPD
jgi:hypothetical protein